MQERKKERKKEGKKERNKEEKFKCQRTLKIMCIPCAEIQIFLELFYFISSTLFCIVVATLNNFNKKNILLNVFNYYYLFCIFLKKILL